MVLKRQNTKTTPNQCWIRVGHGCEKVTCLSKTSLILTGRPTLPLNVGSELDMDPFARSNLTYSTNSLTQLNPIHDDLAHSDPHPIQSMDEYSPCTSLQCGVILYQWHSMHSPAAASSPLSADSYKPDTPHHT